MLPLTVSASTGVPEKFTVLVEIVSPRVATSSLLAAEVGNSRAMVSSRLDGNHNRAPLVGLFPISGAVFKCRPLRKERHSLTIVHSAPIKAAVHCSN